MTTQTTTTFVGVVGRDENLFRETKSGGSAGGNQAILRSFPQIFGKIFICSTDTSKKKRVRFCNADSIHSLPVAVYRSVSGIFAFGYDDPSSHPPSANLLEA